MPLGAAYQGENCCEFVVWAPRAEKVELQLLTPVPRIQPMTRAERGYWQALVMGGRPGTDYCFRLNGKNDRPDPASHWQPYGVHRASRVVDHSVFPWRDEQWQGIPLERLVIYELHVGTFTPEGTFAAIIPRLPELAELGITAIELMPVAQFPGEGNWGYDGVHPFAVQNSYGGPDGLKALVDACHGHGLAVVLDVVYNHLGPEGNYLREFGPYFTDRYHSPWGEAVNFDSAGRDEVRRFFIENARHWFVHYHVDILRIDAVHAIYDFSAKPFLQELAEEIRQLAAELRRPCLLIAESDLNDSRVIRSPQAGGYGLDAQWNDDFHHAVHTLLTGETQGYYQDFGRAGDLVAALREGFAYAWRYSPYRRRRHGNSAADLPGRRFVVCSQNHDQIGNRPQGERLIALAGFEGAKLAAAAVLLSPFVPLLFMGEEYGEAAPFQYFVSFLDAGLNEAVRRGRVEDLRRHGWMQKPADPCDPATFARSKPAWELRLLRPGKEMLEYYRRLLALRREIPALADLGHKCCAAGCDEERQLVWMRRGEGNSQVLVLMNFSPQPVPVSSSIIEGEWEKLFDSADPVWLGSGALLPDHIASTDVLHMPERSCALLRRSGFRSPESQG